MKLQKGTLKNLQEYAKEKAKERGFSDETLQETLLLLTEEVGELTKACRKANNMYVESGKETNHTPAQEIADVLNMTLAVANKLGIDLEKEFLQKEEEVDKRKYERAGKVKSKE